MTAPIPPAPNPLVAQPDAGVSWFTGIGPIEALDTIAEGFDNGSWVQTGLGTVGLAAEAVSTWFDPIGTVIRWAASWLMERLEPAKRFLDWLGGNPPVIEAHAATWKNVSGLLASTAEDIEKAVSTDLAQWTGDAAATYRAQIAEHVTGLREASTLCATASGQATLIAAVVGAVRATVRELIAGLVSWLVQSIGWVVLTGPFGATQAVRTAIAEIFRVTGVISELVAKLSRSFATLRAKVPALIDVYDQVIAKLAPKKTSPRLGARRPTARPPTARPPSTTPAIHAGTMPEATAADYLRKIFPHLEGINAQAYQQNLRWARTNCARAAVAFERMMRRGTPEVARRRPNMVQEDTVAQLYGRDWEVIGTPRQNAGTRWNTITATVDALPVGGRGIVSIERTDGTSHVINVLRTGDGVVYVDAQLGTLAELEPTGVRLLSLMVTHP
ncbi:putative Rhs protein [Alloactinosynnema sp. L-07]|uniref:toxin glutamine deamidase domain-containing protein n=1 Tax=Alloactinosynnema sp. L-07 TaxID=1653480 RepID=UPI00065EFF72|nr:toxin glutamine deamidase domain-containing protein [Alloactinosynnema sp. L-07]CRK58172.1 putative Rhs protein [Alloactinosynnema sp. L-07]